MTAGPPVDRDRPATAARRVARNTAYLAGVDITTRAMSMVFFLVAARHLGAGEFGVLTFALALINMLGVLTDLGLGLFTAREIARDHGVAQSLVSTVVAMKLTASVVVIGAIVLLVRLLGYPSATIRVVCICSVFIPVNALMLYYGSVFQGFERNVLAVLGRLAQAAIMITGALLLSRGRPFVDRYALVYIGACTVAVLVTFVLVSVRFVRPALDFRLREWGCVLRPALPFAVTTILVAFYYWSGSVFLSKMAGDEAVGIYNAPFRLVAGVSLLATAFSGAVYPVMSRMFVKDAVRLSRVIERSFRYAVALAVPIGVLGVILARPATLLVFGSGYAASAAVMRILVWWGSFVCLSSLLSNYFFAVDRPRTVTIQAALSLSVSLVLNLTLIPRVGALGAAVAIAVAELAGFVFLLANQLRAPGRMGFSRLVGSVVRSLAAALAAAPIVWVVARWHALAGLGVALLGYFALMILFRGFGRDDLNMLRLMLRGEGS